MWLGVCDFVHACTKTMLNVGVWVKMGSRVEVGVWVWMGGWVVLVCIGVF